MKTKLILAVVLLAIAVGIYSVATNGKALPPEEAVNSLVSNWQDFQKSLSQKPVLGATSWNYPNLIQFLDKDKVLIEYEDGHVLHYSVLKLNPSGEWSEIETLPDDRLTVSEWEALKNEYGSLAFTPITFKYEGSDNTPTSEDWKKVEANPFDKKEKTYENQDLGISFNYPDDLEVSTSTTSLFEGCREFSVPKVAGCASLQKTIGLKNSLVNALINDVVYDASGLHPNSIDDFEKVKIGDNDFYKIKVGRFEGVLTYNYYLPVDNKIFAFSFTSRGVDWTNPNLDEESDPNHLVLKDILASTKVRKEPETAIKPCKVTGCSAQVCSDEDVVTTCEYNAVYACYKDAKCERQAATGKCGWTETPEFKKCVSSTAP